MMTRIMCRPVRLGLAACLSISLAACPTMNPLVGPGSSTETTETESPQTTGEQPARATPAPRITAAEAQLKEDEKRFNATLMGGAFVGAVVGAGAGVVGCHLAGYKDARLRNCILATTVTGGVVGGVDGYVTAKREAAGRNEVRALQATIADVKQDNAKLRSFIANSDRVLTEGRARLAALQGDVAQRRLTATQADAARKREEGNIASMNNALTNAKQTRSNYVGASKQLTGDARAKRDLDAEIRRMNEQIAQLERNVGEYNRALAVSRA